jgi:hypothetical protein
MVSASASCAVAGDQTFEDLFGEYFHRIDAITVGAGNAKEVNAASQVIDPWPPHVRNRRIPANGARMTGAIQRYQDVRRLKEAAPTLAPDSISPTGFPPSTAVSH